MKKAILAIVLGIAASLTAQNIDKKKEIIDTILQIENYSTQAETLIKSMGSSLSADEFIEKFSKEYSKAEFQNSLIEAFDKKFNDQEAEEIYKLIQDDLYKKHVKKFSNFGMSVGPKIAQILIQVAQSSSEKTSAEETKDILTTQSVGKKKEIIDTILQIDSYSTHAEKIIASMGSNLTVDEFMEKFSKEYSKPKFQNSLIKAFDKNFNDQEVEEVYELVKSDLYKKYVKEFTNFTMEVSPKIAQILMQVAQSPFQIPSNEETSSTDRHESKIIIADENNFDDIIKQNKSVIVDIYASWCGPCKALSPILEELSKDFEGQYVFVKVNADNNHQLVSKLKAKGLPTLVFYQEGQEVHRQVGFTKKDQLVELIHSSFNKK